MFESHAESTAARFATPRCEPHRESRKCESCQLVFFIEDTRACPRCRAPDGLPDEIYDLAIQESLTPTKQEDPNQPRIGLRERALLIVAAVLAILSCAYASLVITSEAITYQERRQVNGAIDVLREKGFTSEAAMLSTLTSFRRTDNWWNNYLGHPDAYAATNFPFQIVTLYPKFFDAPIDDRERAAILLHEAQHLFGANEERACDATWRARHQLGWTEESYGATKVYRNVEKLTHEYAPQVFRCGLEGTLDCTK